MSLLTIPVLPVFFQHVQRGGVILGVILKAAHETHAHDNSCSHNNSNSSSSDPTTTAIIVGREAALMPVCSPRSHEKRGTWVKTSSQQKKHDKAAAAAAQKHTMTMMALTPLSLAVPPSTTPATLTPGDPGTTSSSWMPSGFGSDTRTKSPSFAIIIIVLAWRWLLAEKAGGFARRLLMMLVEKDQASWGSMAPDRRKRSSCCRAGAIVVVGSSRRLLIPTPMSAVPLCARCLLLCFRDGLSLVRNACCLETHTAPFFLHSRRNTCAIRLLAGSYGRRAGGRVQGSGRFERYARRAMQFGSFPSGDAYRIADLRRVRYHTHPDQSFKARLLHEKEEDV